MYAGKPRPVVIIQDNAFVDLDSLTFFPLTTHDLNITALRVPIAVSTTGGGSVTSFVEIDKITTLHRRQFSRQIGNVTSRDMRKIEGAMLAFLGIGSPR
jgi:mRNA interferase MazF